LVGLATQLIGNLSQLWAMSVVGLAVTITINIGVNLVTCAVLGRMLLGERVSLQSIAAMLLVMVSVGLLSIGAGPANDALAASAGVSTGPLYVAGAIAVSCLAGAVYGALGVAIRGALLQGAPLPTIVFIVPFLGLASFGPISLYRQGLTGLLQTSSQDLLLMLAAGVLNLLAFAAIIKGLEIMTVLHVNLINALQVALAALAGFLFFSEPPGLALILGVVLSIAGIVMIDRPVATEREVSASEPI
jgi:drug/metabolite transporter (DMT)-like permease